MIDTSKRQTFAVPSADADRAAAAALLFACCGLFAFWIPEGMSMSRQARALIVLGFTPRQIAIGVGILCFGITIWMSLVWRRLALSRPYAVELSPDGLVITKNDAAVQSPWTDVRCASVTWVSRVPTLQVILEAKPADPIALPSTEVVGDVEIIARLIEAYRETHSSRKEQE
ncbi:MAG: hypothetical protein Rubg2KO_17070 [Rubricoccaceae bacterium]